MMTDQQLSLDKPFPATPAEREQAVLAAFGPTAGWRIVQMRANRYPCPACRATVGDACRRMKRGRAQRLKAPHASRVAITVPCETHGRERGHMCNPNGVAKVCRDRENAVKDLLARPDVLANQLATDHAVTEEHDFRPARQILDWAEAEHPPPLETVSEPVTSAE